VTAALPDGLVVTGASYDGIGIPACIDQAQRAARGVATRLTAASPA
jgi:protoporphyrinogen oxidase